MADYYTQEIMDTAFAIGSHEMGEIAEDTECWDFVQVFCGARGLDLSDSILRSDMPLDYSEEGKTQAILNVFCSCSEDINPETDVILAARSEIIMVKVSDSDVALLSGIEAGRSSIRAIEAVEFRGETGPLQYCHIHGA